MKAIVRQADRVAIWHPELFRQADIAEVIGGVGDEPQAKILPFPVQPHNTDVPFEELPEHDWTQHGLGDPEHWEEENVFRQLDAALADYGITAPNPKSMNATGEELGTHKAQVWNNPQSNENWLVKKPPKNAKFLADGDVAASAIQQYSRLHTPPTFKTKVGGQPASMQLMIPGAKDAYPDKAFDPEKVNDDDLLTIQKHHALDWLIGNHDAHGGQFIRNPEGQLVGIDKGQAFKHYSQDRLHWNYHPNSSYDEVEPVYNALYRNFAQGGRQLHDPRQGELGQFIQHLQNIPDNELANTLAPYANGAADAGQLAKLYTNYTGHDKARFAENDPAQFLKAVLARKNNLGKDFGDLYDRAMAHRMTGTKIARVAAAPDPHQLHDEEETLGSNQRAKVYSDPQGRWLLKQPEEGNEFMVPLDMATNTLQLHAGLETPETWAVPMEGNLATVSKMYHGAQQPWEEPPALHQLSPQDLQTIQKHQVLDWLIGNHDAHVGNWLRTREGKLVGIDKGQAAKYFGRDKLDWNFHPNYYAREPIYNNLWRNHAAGQGEMNDPRQGPIGDFVKKLQDIPDHELKSLFAPYAHSAAQSGQLATGGPEEYHAKRGLSTPKFAPNDPDSFLNAMVERKNNLATDLGGLYDRATKARSQTQRSAPQPAMPQEMEDFGVHQGKIHRQALGGGLMDMGTSLLNQIKTPSLPKLPTAPTAPTAPQPPSTPDAPNPTSPPGSRLVSPLTLPGFNGIPFHQPGTTPAPSSPSMSPSTTTPSGGGSGSGGMSTTGVPGSPTPGKGGVPLVQRPDGRWTSSDPAWAHLIDRESGGVNQRQKIQDVNSGGNEAEGLFQITPATWKSHGGDRYAPSAISATPQQQADIAAQIFRNNPSGSDWGAGLSGREDPTALSRGLGS